jgi:hypothetical protein
MSCGNRFSCGIKRYQQPTFAPDRPSNPELHKENETRLSELLRLREEQDKALSFSTSTSAPAKVVQDTAPMSSSSDGNYTPWTQYKTTN